MTIQTFTNANGGLAAALAVADPKNVLLGDGVVTVRTGSDYTAPATPTPTSEAASALAAGLTITSSSTPAVNGVYAVDSNAQSRFTQVMSYVSSFGVFPKSAATLPWLLADGTTVVAIPSIAVFKAIAQAVADYAYSVDEYANRAPGSSLPIADMAIA
jgi:hypothetical protein